MTQKEAFDHVIAVMKDKAKELVLEIENEENYLLKRRMSEDIKSYESSIEYLQDIMIDLKIG
jgi:hypothetical protein